MCGLFATGGRARTTSFDRCVWGDSDAGLTVVRRRVFDFWVVEWIDEEGVVDLTGGSGAAKGVLLTRSPV